MAFTDAKIKSLKPSGDGERRIEWEDGATGLGVRIGQHRKSFVFMYRHQGRSRMMTIGNYPKTSLVDARLKVAEARERLDKGYDPSVQWIETKNAVRDAETLKELAEIYLTRWARVHKKARSAKDDEDILRRNVLPGYGHLKARDVRKRDIIAILQKIGERGAKVQANRTLAVVRKMFNFAVETDILETTPCLGVKALFPEFQRDRVLSEEEITKFWKGLANPEIKMNRKTAVVLKLMLITGQRKGEIIRTRWGDIDFAERTWTITSTVTKNGLLHIVPLSEFAIRLLQELKSISHESQWLFPTRLLRDTHIEGQTVDHAARRSMKVIGLSDFTPHDLRRTAASHMTAKGISREIVKKIINHADRDITAIYDRYSYLPEKRSALEAWAGHLERIISGQKRAAVVQFVRKRR